MDQGRRFKGEVTEKRRNDTNTVLDVDFRIFYCNSVFKILHVQMIQSRIILLAAA
jgi:hypothetical protein